MDPYTENFSLIVSVGKESVTLYLDPTLNCGLSVGTGFNIYISLDDFLNRNLPGTWTETFSKITIWLTEQVAIFKNCDCFSNQGSCPKDDMVDRENCIGGNSWREKKTFDHYGTIVEICISTPCTPPNRENSEEIQ